MPDTHDTIAEIAEKLKDCEDANVKAFLPFFALPVEEQQKVIDMYTDVITYKIAKVYPASKLFHMGDDTEDKVLTALRATADTIANPEPTESDGEWQCWNCGAIRETHPLFHVYLKHYL